MADEEQTGTQLPQGEQAPPAEDATTQKPVDTSENRSENQSGEASTDTSPVVKETPVPTPTPTLPANEPKPTPQEETVVVAPVSTASPQETSVSSTKIQDGDDEQVKQLKIMLAAFKRASARPGKVPEDFKEPAKQISIITKFIIQYPKVPVLDTLLAFFKENIDDVCSANYLRGTTTLTSDMERKVAFLYNMWSELAREQVVRIETQLVVSVLQKPEIVNYYNRKIAGIQQAQKREFE